MVDALLVQLIKHKTTLHDLSDDSLTALDNRLAELRMMIGFETEGRKILEETYMDTPEHVQNKVETREVEEYYIHIDSNDGYIAKRIMAYDLEDAKRQATKYFSQDRGKTVVIRPKHSKKAVKIVIE